MSQGMNIGSLEHVNVRTAKLPQMIKWYEEVLGMRNGWRPNFPFGGAWMYSGDNKPTVHLVEVKEDQPQGLRLEHFAFSATGMRACVERCKAHNVAYELIAVKDAGLVQVNVYDPDGNHIHIDFPAHEADDMPEIGGFTGLPGRM
jgi:catechol 2,3-dioxygenase-like lactoylglutathione lyase family enzyme